MINTFSSFNLYTMFLTLPHTKLDVYLCARKMVLECYRLAKRLPEDERFALAQQIKRASTSVSLNIAEGCSRKSSTERKRFFEIARGSVIEIDSILDTFFDLAYFTMEEMAPTGELLNRNFSMLSSMLKKS